MENIVYFIELSESLDPQQNILIDFISEEKKCCLKKRQFNIDMKLGLYAELLVRCQICKLLNVSNQDIVFDVNKNGKPYLRGYPNFYFNISHTKTAVIVAFSNTEIGADIEKIKTVSFDIMNRHFTETEQRYILESMDKDRAFYEVWTRKEAYFKHIGKGLQFPLTSFDVMNPPIKLQIQTFQLNDYIISVCAENYGISFHISKLFEDQFTKMVLNSLM